MKVKVKEPDKKTKNSFYFIENKNMCKYKYPYFITIV